MILFFLVDLFSSRPSGTKRPAQHFRYKQNKKPRIEENKSERRSSGKFKKSPYKSDGKFSKGGKKFKGKKGVDKTNSANRDRRPIGGKLANKKFKNKNKGRNK